MDGVCRFPFDLATVFTCPGCTAFKHSLHSSHTKVLGDCRYAATQTRRVGFRTSADPYVPPQTAPEAAPDDVVFSAPPMSSVGAWSPVLDQIAIKFLDLVGSSDGWKQHDNSQVLVVSDGRDLRTPEPRFSLADYPLRSVYALFPDHVHAKGTWWQLQDNVKAMVRGTVGYPCPILVTVFHRATPDTGAGDSSVKIKPALPPQRTWLPASASVN